MNKRFNSVITGLSLSIASLSLGFTSPATADAIKVNTSAYKDIAIKLTHTLGGVVPAAQDSNISAQISAIIDKFHVDTGNEVNKGELLVSLNCEENWLRLKQAEADLKAERVQLAHARTKFDQAKKLDKQGNISKEIYNQREAEENRLKATLENRKAARAIAQINVDRCNIKAPYDGYITDRHASIGELTQPGTPLVQLVSKSNNIVEVKINNRLLNSFSEGENFQFVFNNRSYPLQVDVILPVLDTTTRNHIARLSFIDKQATTGSVGKVQWQDRNTSIPSSYIALRDSKLGVFIAENDRAKFIELKDATEGQPAKVNQDRVSLGDDTQVITRGRFNVKHGDAIIIETP